jgi:glycolate oxidase iron-sulfur subunit
MLHCVRCGLCLSVCPTYQETFDEEESPRGRIAMARALTEGHLGVTPDLLYHLDRCLLCDACTAICPAGVQMEELGVALRTALEERRTRSRRERMLRHLALRRLFPHMSLFRALVRILWLYQKSGLQRALRASGLLRLAEMEALLPPVDGRFLVPRGQVWGPRAATLPSQGSGDQAPRQAALFAGCVMSTALAEIDRATMRVLQANGFTVYVPAGQGCCGALNAHLGDREGARLLARRTIAAFEQTPEMPVVVNSAGCGAMLKHYPHLLADDPAYAARAQRFAARVRDISELLYGLLHEGQLNTAMGPVGLVATYQAPCHLAHAQRLRAEPLALLRRVPGLELRPLPEADLCCGSAGVYNLTQPDMAARLLQRKLDQIEATGAEAVISANPGCIMQIAAGLRRRATAQGRPSVRVLHLVEVLDQAYRNASQEAPSPC